MVCNGILPVDQLREYTGPVGLLCRHIPREVLEAFYGIRIKIKDEGEEGYVPRPPTSEEFLRPYASKFILFIYLYIIYILLLI